MENIKEILKLSKDNTVDFGCMNGWGKEMFELYREFKKLEIPGSGRGVNLGRCYNRSLFDVNINDKIYTIISEVDSGD